MIVVMNVYVIVHHNTCAFLHEQSCFVHIYKGRARGANYLSIDGVPIGDFVVGAAGEHLGFV